jgi:site-specific DNA-methyltransferase (adenine-specific)
MNKKFKLMLGDNIESLKKLPDNSIDSIVSDPPYGLSFMSKKWDYDVPSVEFWKEAIRVLKPGGHVLSFGGTRTYHRLVVNMEDAGFEIRDQIQWIYGVGFPKSHNIGKSFDNKSGNEITKGTSQYEGWGTALKPANEPICLARKPLSEKTIVDNVIKWGTGGINIDGCRIEGLYGSGKNEVIEGKEANVFNDGNEKSTGHKNKIMVSNEYGRFPANVLLDEVAAEFLDKQTGILKGDNPNRKPRNGGHRKEYVGTENNERSGNGDINNTKYVSDNNGASRFFYVAKVSKKERNLGLDNFEEVKFIGDETDMANANQDGPYKTRPTMMKNNHPTLKPINLMTYLCRLITPPGGIILDPFMGSGSTGIAACLEGFRFVGMELEENYFNIAEARINSYEKYRSLLKTAEQ